MDILILDENKFKEFIKQSKDLKFYRYNDCLNSHEFKMIDFFCEFFKTELDGFTGKYEDKLGNKFYFTNGKYGSDTDPAYISPYGAKYYLVGGFPYRRYVTKKVWQDRKAYCGTSLKSFPTRLQIKAGDYNESVIHYGKQLKVYVALNGIYIIEKEKDISCLHPSFVYERREIKTINLFKNSKEKYNIEELNPQEMELKYIEYMKGILFP